MVDRRSPARTAQLSVAPGDDADSFTAWVGPHSIRDGSTTVPFAGYVPWNDAVADPHDPRVIYVYADGDNIKTTKLVCGLPTERVHVTSMAGSVTVLVAGYATPLPRGAACAGVGTQVSGSGSSCRRRWPAGGSSTVPTARRTGCWTPPRSLR